MTARILVVDDHFPNVKLLEARLTAEYFDVVAAMNGPAALDICERGGCDVVLLDVMMPGMDGFEVCRRLKASPATAHLPVVMVTALDQPADRLRGLEAGADDFLTKPVNEVALLARVRSLSRLKVLTDELRSRALASREFGASDALIEATAETGLGGRVLLVEDRASAGERMLASLRQHHVAELEPDAKRALARAGEEPFDLVMVSLGLAEFDGLRLCSQVRSVERTRKTPLLAIADLDDEPRVLRALDLGVNDYVMRPVDRNEMLARVRTQVRRKRYADRLAEGVRASLELAIIDPLTGLHNRRYMQSHLANLVGEGVGPAQDLALLVLDIDHFKAVNDGHGHDAGDEVLKEFALRLKRHTRGTDLVCRHGGEEFVVVMPDTDHETALLVAERLRRAVAAAPFPVHGGRRALDITVSVGLAAASRGPDSPAAIIKRADEALYEAKRDGRNRVVARAA